MIIKLTKLVERNDVVHTDNIETGYETIKDVYENDFEIPEVGKCFYLIDKFGKSYFRTSTVQEIIDENTFKTYNSVYRWSKI